MEKDGIEVEVDKTESEIREERADNVREYFKAKKSGKSFTPTEVKTTKSVSEVRGFGRSFDRIESFIREKDAYSEEVRGQLDHIKRFMDFS